MTPLWIFSPNSCAALANVKYGEFVYENALALTKQAEFKSVGWVISVPGIMRIFGELRLRQKVCFSARRRIKMLYLCFFPVDP